VSKKFPEHPTNPHRICWGCDAYCPAGDMRCGNGSDRTPHPAELFGDDWHLCGLDDAVLPPSDAVPASMPVVLALKEQSEGL
jgi:hypothetical protein